MSMKTLAIGLIAAASISTAAVAADINKIVDDTNFLVNDNCSATYIGDSQFLTAAHCLEDQYQIVTKQEVDEKGEVKEKKVRVSIPGTVSQFTYVGPNISTKVSYTFNVVKTDKLVDLGLIKIMMKLDRPGVVISCEAPKRLDQVYAVGNPLGKLYATVSKGNVSNTHRSYLSLGIGGYEDKGLTQTTAPIGGGSSGGALLDENGSLVGVNVRGYQAIAPVAFAVELKDIRTFLELPACKQ